MSFNALVEAGMVHPSDISFRFSIIINIMWALLVVPRPLKAITVQNQ